MYIYMQTQNVYKMHYVKKKFDVLIALQINRFDSTSLKYQSGFSHVFTENACTNVTLEPFV